MAGQVLSCVVCATERECFYSLRLKRGKEDRQWHSQPVCPDCKKDLIQEAKAVGKFIPFFGIEGSVKEAARRNGRHQALRPFLEKYAVASDKPKGAKPRGESKEAAA